VPTFPAQALLGEPLEVIENIQVEYDNEFSKYYPVVPELRLHSRRYRYLKRAFDLLFSFFMLIVLAVPGLLIAAAIVLTSRGPVFYREERVGCGGRLFRIWKFRSMRQNAPFKSRVQAKHTGGVVLEWRMCKQRRDPRITAVGGFIRRWSLDELPQLFNVLRGEMSLVGPRPIVETEMYLYGDLLPYYLAAIPGLSGAWQVSGRSEVGYDDRARLDAIYVSSWSLKTDLCILFMTLPAVLSQIGAY